MRRSKVRQSLAATVFGVIRLGLASVLLAVIDHDVVEEGEMLMSRKKFQTLALTAMLLAGSIGLAFAQKTSDHGYRIGPRGPASGTSGAGVSTSRTGKAAGGDG